MLPGHHGTFLDPNYTFLDHQNSNLTHIKFLYLESYKFIFNDCENQQF